MIREREGLHAKQNYLHVYAGTKCMGAYGQGGGHCGILYTVISRGILRILLELLLMSTQFAVGFIIVACKQILHINGLISDCACLS